MWKPTSWRTTFVLYGERNDDTAICTETFQYNKSPGEGGVGCLKSTIHWIASNDVQEFQWEESPDPEQGVKKEGSGK